MASNNRTIQVTIQAIDKASQVYQAVGGAMNSMVGRINTGVNSINNSLHRYNSAMSGMYRSTQLALAGAGYLMYRFTRDSINQFAEFERQHGKTMGAIAANYDKSIQAQKQFMADQQKLKEDSLRLGTIGPNGKGSTYNPTQVAYAQTSLAKAGLKPSDISVALPQILKFAGGNDLAIETASDYAVNIGTMFDIPKQKWGSMLDQITRAADISTIDVPDLFESLKYAGGIASSLKRPLDEVLAMISVMGNAGLKGSMAGTGIQAFFTRLLNPAGMTARGLAEAPTPYVEKLMDAFVKETTTPEGKFKDVATVTGMMDDIMGKLSDKEQAWFAQKLFGLMQMKAGFMLSNNGGGTLQGLINDIDKNAPGTNDRKWDIMLNTTWGKQMALQNAMTGVKTDIGYRLGPITSAVADELFKALNDRSMYKIDFNNLRKSIEDASKLIEEQYGKQLGDLVRNLGNVALNGSRALVANEPLAEGFANGLAKLLSGDVVGAFQAVADSVGRADDNISKLPEDLQGLADQVKNVIIALGTLAGVNFTARLLENITTIWKFTVGKAIGGGSGANVLNSTRTITANVVNVYGTTVNGGGGTGLPATGGTPTTGAKPKTTGSKVKAGVNAATWIYALGEMFGINDKILDGMGIKEGTKTRDTIDKGRNVLDWGLTASMIDDVLLKGVVKTAIKGIGTDVFASLLGGGGAALLGTSLLPFAMILPGLIQTKQESDAYDKRMQENQDAAKQGRNIYLTGDAKNPVVYGRTQQERDAAKYQYGGGVGGGTNLVPAKPKSTWGSILDDSYQKQLNKYNQAVANANYQSQLDKARWETAQTIYQKNTGGKMTWDEYTGSKTQWQKLISDTYLKQYMNNPALKQMQDNLLAGSQAFRTLADAVNQNKANNSVVVNPVSKALSDILGANNGQAITSKLDEMNKSIITASQNPIPINLQVQAPPVTVQVTVDSSGNVTKQKTYIGNLDMLEDVYRNQSARYGGSR